MGPLHHCNKIETIYITHAYIHTHTHVQTHIHTFTHIDTYINTTHVCVHTHAHTHLHSTLYIRACTKTTDGAKVIINFMVISWNH